MVFSDYSMDNLLKNHTYLSDEDRFYDAAIEVIFLYQLCNLTIANMMDGRLSLNVTVEPHLEGESTISLRKSVDLW